MTKMLCEIASISPHYSDCKDNRWLRSKSLSKSSKTQKRVIFDLRIIPYISRLFIYNQKVMNKQIESHRIGWKVSVSDNKNNYKLVKVLLKIQGEKPTSSITTRRSSSVAALGSTIWFGCGTFFFTRKSLIRPHFEESKGCLLFKTRKTC